LSKQCMLIVQLTPSRVEHALWALMGFFFRRKFYLAKVMFALAKVGNLLSKN
jgi:hypothetical protein